MEKKLMDRVKELAMVHEAAALSDIDEMKAEYLDDDWEDEFDDIHEAYEEQGRGQAESAVVQDLIDQNIPELHDDEIVEAMDYLADQWGISFD